MIRRDLQTLIAADASGHILERIGYDWLHYAASFHRGVLLTAKMHPYEIMRSSAKAGLIHWLDPLTYFRGAFLSSVPQVVMIHHCEPDDLVNWRLPFSFADGVTTSSVYYQNIISRAINRNVDIIPYTVDIEKYRPLSRNETRRKHGIPEDLFLAGFVAKSVANPGDRKGVDLLKKVLIAASSCLPGFAVLIIGSGWSSLAAELEKCGVRAFRKEVSYANETASLYSLMDVLLITSRNEGGPCTLLEAMACGVPVITSQVGHVPEVVKSGESSIICTDRTVNEYLDGCRALFANSDYRAMMSIAAREAMVGKRDSRKVIPNVDFFSIYKSACTHHENRSVYCRMAGLFGTFYHCSRFVLSSCFGGATLK